MMLRKIIAGLLLAAISVAAGAVNYVGVTQVPVLTVTVSGGGSVSSSPSGINSCTSTGGTCSASFTPGTTVVLTATPNSSNASSTVHGTGTEAYGNWGGSACASTAATSTCSFTFGSAVTASVSFTPKDSDIWWLSPSGSDTLNNGRSRSTPYATWNKVASVMAAGDTVYLDDGTYNQSIGTSSSSTSTTNWVNGTVVKSTRVLGYSRSLCAPNCSASVTGAVVDGQYTKMPFYVWRSAFIESAYITYLHGNSNGPGIIDGTVSGSTVGANLTVNCVGGAASTITINNGGSSFPAGSTWQIALFGGGIQNASATITTNGSGVVNTATVDSGHGGTGCGSTGTTYAVADMRVSNVWVHDNVFAYALPGSSGANIAVGAMGCNGCVWERNLIYGFGSRYQLLMYLGANNVVRQNVCRYDGAPNGQPKGCVAVYDQDNTIVENNIALDWASDTDTTADVHAPFFGTCSVAPSVYPYGQASVSWYGNIAIGAAGYMNGAFYEDAQCSSKSNPDGLTTAVVTLKDNVVGSATGSVGTGFWFGQDTQSTTTHPGNHNIVFDHNTAYNINSGTNEILRLDNSGWGTVSFTNSIIWGGTFTTTGCYYQPWSGTPTASNNFWYACDNALHNAMPGATNTNPQLSYLERCETSTNCKGAGTSSSDVGARVVNQYQNGTLTGNALWPFPNEALFVNELCKGPDTSNAATCETSGNTSCTIYTRGHNTTGICASGKTLTKYIWEQLGNTSPY